MHGGEQQIIPAIAKMRDTAFGLTKIPHRRGFIDRRHALPDQTHRGLCVEVKPAHPACAFHHIQQRGDGIDAEAEQRIAYGAKRFDVGQHVGEATADDAQPWRGVVEYRVAKNHRFGILAGPGDEVGNQGGGVLAIAIHHQGMGEISGRSAQTMQHGSTFAAVARPDEDAQVWVLSGPFSERFARAVGAAVYDDPDGVGIT